MKLARLRISNFQCFEEAVTRIELASMTYLLGPNGAGKTAVLAALARLFSSNPALRRTRKSDFHVPHSNDERIAQSICLWVEAEFEFAELKDPAGKHPTIPGHFAHMQLESADGVPTVVIRLTATLDDDGEIEEALNYVVSRDAQGSPKKMVPVPKLDRNAIQVHYLPARRDPVDHISSSSGSLLGRILRSADWQKERDAIATLSSSINETLAGNASMKGVSEQLAAHWGSLHTGSYYSDPQVSFVRSEIELLLRQLTLGFGPGHETPWVDVSRLSDGQQSLLYLSLVLTAQAIGRQVLEGSLAGFDVEKLRPPVYTLVAMEEPENSLSPHYLGRIIQALTGFAAGDDAQAIIATHAPALLRRVPPESVRYLRLNERRATTVTSILLPPETDEAHKFVREAVQAFPELYFSRFVILGEGDSEEIVLPRLLQARGLAQDDRSISVAPLGGRHVNHFWRLLHGLGIPFATLLDLDLARYQGGWGRLKYALGQLMKFPVGGSEVTQAQMTSLLKWDGPEPLLKSEAGAGWLHYLESVGVFFSSPLDLDFALLRRFPAAYGLEKPELGEPDDEILVAVLGKSHGDAGQYSAADRRHFGAYHRRFKLGSKPAAHLAALAQLDDAAIRTGTPKSIGRLLDHVTQAIARLPE